MPARSLLLLAALLCALAWRPAAAYTLPPSSTQCRQLIGDGVNIRYSPSTSAPKEDEALGRCARVHYMGVKVTSGGLEWAKIWWRGNERWVAAQYLAYCPATACKAVSVFRGSSGIAEVAGAGWWARQARGSAWPWAEKQKACRGFRLAAPPGQSVTHLTRPSCSTSRL